MGLATYQRKSCILQGSVVADENASRQCARIACPNGLVTQMIWTCLRRSLLMLLLAMPIGLKAQDPPEQKSNTRQQPTPQQTDTPPAESQSADPRPDPDSDTAGEIVAGEDSSADPPVAEIDDDPPLPPGPTPDSTEVDPSDSSGRPQLTPEQEKEYREELARRIEKFKTTRDELEEAIWQQRVTYIHYANGEVRNPDAADQFYAQRKKARELLDQTFEAALDVSRIGMDKEAATFLITMIQHRFEHDIYDLSTMEGAARMIDGGSKFTFLFQACARSAVVTGNFEMAKNLFEAVDEEQREDTDLSLAFYLDQLKENFEKEQRQVERDAALEEPLPQVLLRTSQGDVLIELFIKNAPSTVAHFISLVEDGFYDGHDFFQVIDDLLALTGDPTGAGDGNCGKYLLDEHQSENARPGMRGSLVMAKTPKGTTGEFFPNSASSQFAIFLLPLANASEHQTIFGRVIEGMDAVSRLRRVDPSKKKKKGEVVLPPDLILEAKVVRRPDVLPEPVYVQIPGR